MPVSLGWWNGIHKRLKISRRKACGFESRSEHVVKNPNDQK